MSLFTVVRFLGIVCQTNLEIHFAHSFLACEKKNLKVLEVSLPTYKYLNSLVEKAVLAQKCVPLHYTLFSCAGGSYTAICENLYLGGKYSLSF